VLIRAANRSFNFGEAFTKLYEATEILKEVLELEKTDTMY